MLSNKTYMALTFLVAYWQPLQAASIEPSLPNAGSILQEVQPLKRALPPSNDNSLKIDQVDANQLPESDPFEVKQFAIKGNRSIDTKTLHALVEGKEGQSLTLRQLGELASTLTRYYHEHNYPLAVAIVPAQEVKDGVVTLQVLEASYGKVVLDNQSKLRPMLFNNTASPLKSGELIAGDALNRTLLILNDIPGINVNAEIKQGEAVGTSDLTIKATDAKWWRASISSSNSGSASIGRMRGNANLDLFNPLGLGDILSISGMTAGNSMNYGRASYELLINGQGTRVGAAYSNLYYQLGQQYKSINAHGSSENLSAWFKQPLIRSMGMNLYAQAEIDHAVLKDHIDQISSKTDRTIDYGVISLSGDRRDHLFSDGINLFSLSLSTGKLSFDDAYAKFIDRYTTQSHGEFTKLNLNLTRMQQLGHQFSLYGNLAAQWTNSNLDSSQKMIIGGPYSVRAYDVSALSGDAGETVTLELRKDLPSSIGNWQAVAFYDAAHININHAPWRSGTNDATLQGVGLGLSWQNSNLWSARMSIAAPVGNETKLLSLSSIGPRVWAEVRKDF